MTEREISPLSEQEVFDNTQALQLLKEFVFENYEMIRKIRENKAVHDNFERHLQKIYDAMLDLKFRLQDL